MKNPLPEDKKFPLPEGEEGEAVVIAFLKVVPELSVEEIASVTGLSTATVNRRLKEAIKLGVLKRFVFSPDDDMKEKYAPYFRHLEIEEKVRACVGKILIRNVIVVPSIGDEVENRKRVGQVAAFRLHQKLKSAEKELKIGVSWGRTLRAMTDTLREITSVERAFSIELQRKTQSKKEYSSTLEFVPLCGDFWVNEVIKDAHYYSSERIAADLSECFFNAKPPIEISFPVYIPEKFQGEKNIRDFLDLTPARRMIYGDKNPLIKQLDGIITSVGGVPREMHATEDKLESISMLVSLSEHISREKQEKMEAAGVVGDILGYFITKRGTTHNDVVNGINERFLGPKPEHILECAERAREEGNIGVVIIASGEKKADILHSIIERRYVNGIIIDSELAEKLMDLFDAS